MTQRISTVRDEKGVALPLALFALVMLSGLLLTFLSMSGFEPVIAQNHGSSSRAFYIADAGIEHAWAVLPSTDVPALIQNAGGNLFTAQAFGGGSYSVTVSQNPGGTLLTSTGTYTNASRTIRALVSATAPPAPRGAAEVLIAPGGSYEAHADPGGSFDGRDWIAPANIAACTDIANCGTKISDTGTYGAFANSSSNSFDLSGGGTMYGTNCPPGTCQDAATASNQHDATVLLTRWDNFINAAILQANRTLTGTVLESPSTTYTWGTQAAPEITVINNSADVSWKTKVNGAGVLIIDSPGPTQNLKFSNGELNWEGLVIIRSPGEVQFEIENAAGRIRVFGQVVNRSAVRAEVELNKANNFIKYSSAAMKMVARKFSAFKSWEEVTQ